MKNQLIQIYLFVCHSYDNQSSLKYQRRSNFQPRFSDQEIMTIYLFGQLNEKFKVRQIYDFIREYWMDWFPALPSYQAFARRLNLLGDNFQTLFERLSELLTRRPQSSQTLDYLIDSMPIMLACGTRSKRAAVAAEMANIGYSAVKQQHFYGVRLHLIARRQIGSLPLPTLVWLKAGNVHDLTALKEESDGLPAKINLFADKAYADQTFSRQLSERQINLLTPIKKPKKQNLTDQQKKFNQTISSFRQPIESLFKWLIDKTDIQRASQIRSSEGLMIHCLGKLTFALLLLNFYS